MGYICPITVRNSKISALFVPFNRDTKIIIFWYLSVECKTEKADDFVSFIDFR